MIEKSIRRFNSFLDALQARDISIQDAEEMFDDFFRSKEFLRNLYKSSDTSKGNSSPNSTQDTYRMYKLLTKHRVIRAMISAIEDNDYEYPRGVAVLLYTIAMVLFDSTKANKEKSRDAFVDGWYDRNDYKDSQQSRENSMKDVLMLQKCARKIVKRAAKMIEKKSEMPRELAASILVTVPDSEFIDNSQIGFYATKAFSVIYSYANAVDSETSHNFTEFDTIDWTYVFETVFGKYRQYDVATCLTLEGLSRVQGYRGAAVKEVWNCLTKWALYTLDHSPEDTRTHMIEMYVKRLGRMFKNRNPEIRVNLAKLDAGDYPELMKTVGKYADQIVNIIDAASGIKSIKPDTVVQAAVS